MSPALFALAVAASAIGTTEFVMIGLVPDVARDLTVTIPQAGLLVTGYALAVTVGAPTVTALTGRLPRRGLVVGLMGLFTLGNLLGGAAPTYEVLLAGRIVTGVAHGMLFAVGAPITEKQLGMLRRLTRLDRTADSSGAISSNRYRAQRIQKTGWRRQAAHHRWRDREIKWIVILVAIVVMSPIGAKRTRTRQLRSRIPKL